MPLRLDGRLVVLEADPHVYCAVWRWPIGNFCGRLVEISEYGIFHVIDTYANKNGIENKELFSLVYDRAGIGHWARRNIAKGAFPTEELAKLCMDVIGDVDESG